VYRLEVNSFVGPVDGGTRSAGGLTLQHDVVTGAHGPPRPFGRHVVAEEQLLAGFSDCCGGGLMAEQGDSCEPRQPRRHLHRQCTAPFGGADNF